MWKQAEELYTFINISNFLNFTNKAGAIQKACVIFPRHLYVKLALL